MINDVAVKLQRQLESGREQHIVWNQNSVQLVNAAKVKLLTHVQTKNNRENAAFKKLSSKVNEFMNGMTIGVSRGGGQGVLTPPFSWTPPFHL